jgi:GH15 family glucan-1,4-alpha-glucosidase
MTRQHPIGAHALLADGRTAALIDRDGNVAWLCWPRVDSPPCLLGILDAAGGGRFMVRPAQPDATLAHRAYVPGTLVLRTTWDCGGARLWVDEALVWDGPPRMVRLLRAEGGPVAVKVTFAAAFDAARARTGYSLAGDRCVAEGAGLRLAVRAPAGWEPAGDGMRAELVVAAGGTAAVTLADAASVDEPPAEAALDATAIHWARVATRIAPDGLPDGSVAVRHLGEAEAVRLVRHSALVLAGLTQRGGGIVAAPTTSLPQWPQSSRTWDYRYAWMRDTALAALGLLRAGMADEASALGAFCGDVAAGGEPPPLLRVDGTAAPSEQRLDHLAGHGGARPVRIGNAAAAQTQVDVIGEVLDLAAALQRRDALPASLRRCVPQLADASGRLASRPDHGIWEVRGRRKRYTHSRIMAWMALRRAAAMARRTPGLGDAARWEGAADELHARILAEHLQPSGALSLHHRGGGPDAALTLVPLVGFLRCDEPTTTATLDSIERGLSRDGLLDRYLGQPDHIPDPCAPFLFPTLWLASARERCGGDGTVAFAAAVATRGDGDLFGEVAHPATLTPLGNYPHIQSHAAFILTAFTRPHRRGGPRLVKAPRSPG